MRRFPPALLVMAASAAAWGHDIADDRVDRSIQATVRPGRLEVDYEVRLTDSTLVDELRSLIGPLPGTDRVAWSDRYGRETGPLNAKGLLASVDGRPVDLCFRTFDLHDEGHPHLVFHLDAPVPRRGLLRIQDTNFVANEGSSRLAIRGRDGVAVGGDGLPGEVREIPFRPLWQLTDAEERRTKQVEVRYDGPAQTSGRGATGKGTGR